MNSNHVQLTGTIRLFPVRAVPIPLHLPDSRTPRPWAAAFVAVLRFAGIQIAAGLACLALLPMLGTLMLASAWRQHRRTETG